MPVDPTVFHVTARLSIRRAKGHMAGSEILSRFNGAESPQEGILVMLIKVERGRTSDDWIVWMNACCVKFRSYAEAEAFVKKLKDRINASHPYPMALDRLVVELP